MSSTPNTTTETSITETTTTSRTSTATTSSTETTTTSRTSTAARSTATRASATKPKSLSRGSIAGIAIVVLFLSVLCALLVFFLLRRRRRRRRNTHDSDPPVVAASDVPPQNQVVWHEQPKDDESMLRLYREVDGRLTDHVLNFYVASDGETYGNEISELSNDARRDFGIRVSRFEQLLPRQDSRMFVLRAIIANRVVRAASEGDEAQKTASYQGTYDSDSRDNLIHRITQDAHDETRAFAIPSSNSDVRLHSMETVVRTVVEFVFTMARQPTRFEFTWAFPASEGSSSEAVLNPQTMEVVYQASREGRSAPVKVRATVFPGLRKWRKEEESFLAKAQILLY